MSSREANRARFPELAALTDLTGGKLLYAKDDAGELGKLPVDTPDIAWIKNIPPPYIQPKGKWNSKGEWVYGR